MKKINQLLIIKVVIAITAAVFLISCSKSKGKIKICGIISMSSPAGVAEDGVTLKNGLALAVEEINSKGGINNKEIELIIEDPGTNAEKAKSIYKRMKQEHEPLLFISNYSSVSIELAPLAEKDEVVLLCLVATSPKVTEDRKWTFRYWPTVKDELSSILFLLDMLKVKNLGILYLNDDYGKSMFETLKKEYTANGGIVKTKSFARNELYFKNEIDSLMDTEAIFVVALPNYLDIIFKQLARRKYNKPIISTNAVCANFLRTSPEADGIYINAPIIYSPGFIFKEEMKKKYESRYEKRFNHFAANGYDAINIIKGILKDEEISRNNLRDMLEMDFVHPGLFGDIDSRRGEHDLSFPLYPARISGGEIEYLR
ncbi:ABC transporter substrate-binding protein [Candidatus Poribacteria bacterium]|nr:ABC transporter substrate-binding protein [Candidatus Poribacteria bacterium]